MGRLQKKLASKEAKKSLKDFPSTERDPADYEHSECDCREESDSPSDPDEETSGNSSSSEEEKEEDISEHGAFLDEDDQSQSYEEILEDKEKKGNSCTLRYKHKKGKV